MGTISQRAYPAEVPHAGNRVEAPDTPLPR